MSLLLLDLDGTVRKPLGRHKYIEHPGDQRLLVGVERAIAHYDRSGWTIIGITNQAGVAASKKSLQGCIKEQEYTLALLPQMEAVYFCPDFEGRKCFCVGREGTCNYSSEPESGTFRKPQPGMLHLAMRLHPSKRALMVGDRPEDKAAALSAGIRFQHARDWRRTDSRAPHAASAGLIDRSV
jgi:D-glycero-D-manno-heptose 1,7-bisphosphate phosphatase